MKLAIGCSSIGNPDEIADGYCGCSLMIFGAGHTLTIDGGLDRPVA
jgi:hypothetical protein